MRPITEWPQIQDLISLPYDLQAITQLELDKEPLGLDASLSLEFKSNAALIRAYFDNANTWYACVNPYDWSRVYEKASHSEYREGPESCLVLLVLALGAVSHSWSLSRGESKEPPGMSYFSAAWGLIPTLTISHDVIASQCTILASAYLSCLTRPLEAWTLLSTIIPKLQILLRKVVATPLHRSELSSRVYWNAFLLENSLLASLDLPPSPLPESSSTIPLPAPFAPSDNTPPAYQDDPWLLTALVSLDRLNGRISQDTAHPNATQGPIATALNTQLTDWYTSIAYIGNTGVPPPRADLKYPTMQYLRMQYFLARMRIYRPYILSVLTDESMQLSPLSFCRESCRACIESALRVMEDLPTCLTNVPWLKWQNALATMDAALLIMGVSRSPNLCLLIESSAQTDLAVDGAIKEFEELSSQAPSLARAYEVLKEADARRKGLR